ncbi:MAG: amino acid racemase [Legionellales bacterium]|jgi:aspartate racemase
MKTIGLLGGTGWSSTITYYTLLNELVNQRLGGCHSAKIILKSIDYHEINSTYGKDHEKTAQILRQELSGLVALEPDCAIICCNTLHKYYDMFKVDAHYNIPVFHAVELTARYITDLKYKKVLLLATKFTLEDGFFAKTLEDHGINVIIPDEAQRNEMRAIHTDLILNKVTEQAKEYFSALIRQYKDCDAVVLGCTEYPLVVNQNTSQLPIIDPVKIQTMHAVDFCLSEF